jgi:hypothetical protein
MLNQKDNDFDDLFRRASERYPLRTDSADWNRMDAALDNPPPDLPEEGIDKDKRRKRRFIWLFLLLPLGGAGYFILHQAGVGREQHPQTVGVGQGQPAAGSPAAAGSQKDVASGTQSGDAGGAQPDVAGKAKSGDAGEAKSGDANKAQSGVAGKAQSGTPSGAANVAVAKPAKPDAKSVSIATTKPAGASSVAAAQPTVVAGKDRFKNRFGHHGVGTGAGKDVATAAKVGTGAGANGGGANGRSVDDGTANDGSANRGTADANANNDRRVANYPVGRARTREDYLLTVNVEAPVVAKDSSKTKPKASAKQKSSYLYAGLLAAPDLSTVKFQSMKGVGTTFSLLLGYQFNKKWAVETGISVDRKRYYTDAEYFNTSKLPSGTIPYNWELKNLDGTCYMWEIPINVRYNFSQNERSKWFATAGLSTYLMTRENYNYNYDWWTATGSGNATKNWDWKTPSNYWFSIINLSAGYEHRLGGIGNLRIEPYLRVPLSGLGKGQLNILSAGLNIGITRRLW